jgi:hypothetical protein
LRASLALWGVVFAGLQLDGARHPDSEFQQLIRFQAPPTLSFQDLIDLAADRHNQAPTSVKQIILEHLTDYRFWVKDPRWPIVNRPAAFQAAPQRFCQCQIASKPDLGSLPQLPFDLA